MPKKHEIMRLISEGLNRLDAGSPSKVTEVAVKAKLCRIGRDEFGFYVCAKNVEGTDCGEWLYDVTWLEYDCADNSLIDAHLAAECEWGEREHVYDDFQKLLLARASVLLMIFDGDKCGSMETTGWLAEKVGKFNGSCDEDAWLLAAWERNENEAKGWSFRYFKVRDYAATPFRPSSGE